MVKAQPNWKRMRFKKNKVWVSTDPNQRLVLQKGKALIKYQLDQPHEYWVHPHNLSDLETDEEIMEPVPAANRQQLPVVKSLQQIDEAQYQKAICIYTDGACSGNPGPAGIGVVLSYQGKQRKISRYIGHATNNIAELKAIKVGLQAVKNRKLPVIVFTDSNYAFGLLTKGWHARQNQKLVKEIRNMIPRFKCLNLVKVKGHAGDPGNEQADRLAVQAVEKASMK